MLNRLVDYASDEEDAPPAQKKRKLPALCASLTVPTPVDDPALHQGRVRTVPHVDGQYAAYVYVPVVVSHRDALHAVVEDALTLAKGHVRPVHPIGRQERGGTGPARWELHISLSRPLFVRAHQRDELKRAVRQVASSIAPFDASFATFSELTNDERTRTFLALDVGAGHGELRRCLDLLGPTLRLLRQKEFYVDPKFHASIAWALLEKAASSPSAVGEPETASSGCATPEQPQRTSSASPGATEQPCNDSHCISRFPPALVPSLNATYAAKLSQARTGGFVVDRISMKIGKDVFTWPLE